MALKSNRTEIFSFNGSEIVVLSKLVWEFMRTTILCLQTHERIIRVQSKPFLEIFSFFQMLEWATKIWKEYGNLFLKGPKQVWTYFQNWNLPVIFCGNFLSTVEQSIVEKYLTDHPTWLHPWRNSSPNGKLWQSYPFDRLIIHRSWWWSETCIYKKSVHRTTIKRFSN